MYRRIIFIAVYFAWHSNLHAFSQEDQINRDFIESHYELFDNQYSWFYHKTANGIHAIGKPTNTLLKKINVNIDNVVIGVAHSGLAGAIANVILSEGKQKAKKFLASYLRTPSSIMESIASSVMENGIRAYNKNYEYWNKGVGNLSKLQLTNFRFNSAFFALYSPAKEMWENSNEEVHSDLSDSEINTILEAFERDVLLHTFSITGTISDISDIVKIFLEKENRIKNSPAFEKFTASFDPIEREASVRISFIDSKLDIVNNFSSENLKVTINEHKDSQTNVTNLKNHETKITTIKHKLHDGSNAPVMVVIPSGEFKLGNSNFKETSPVLKVSIKKFAISMTEVTFNDFQKFIDDTDKTEEREGIGSAWGLGQRPAIGVSWELANEYVHWLSLKTGKTYRLPSEAEWEYAARGLEEIFTKLEDPEDCHFARFGTLMGQFCNKKMLKEAVGTVPVKSYQANSLGLYDMFGNAAEWVSDCWTKNYNGKNLFGEPTEVKNCQRHVIRGGNWGVQPKLIGPYQRHKAPPNIHLSTTGIRLALDLQ